MYKRIPKDFDSLPESKVDPSDSDDSGQESNNYSTMESELEKSTSFGSHCSSAKATIMSKNHISGILSEKSMDESPSSAMFMDNDHPESCHARQVCIDAIQNSSLPYVQSSALGPLASFPPFCSSTTQETGLTREKPEAQVVGQNIQCRNSSCLDKEVNTNETKKAFGRKLNKGVAVRGLKTALDPELSGSSTLLLCHRCKAHVNSSIHVQQPCSIRNHSAAVVISSPEESYISSTVDTINREDTEQTLSKVSNLSEKTGLEEDYENNEACVITETDLGEIPVYEKDPNQTDKRKSSNPELPPQQLLNSPITTKHGVSYILQCATDLSKERHKFCKQMLTHNDEAKYGVPQVTEDLNVYEPLKSPSQVLKLIQRFQKRIDGNIGGSISTCNLPMEDISIIKTRSSSENSKYTANQDVIESKNECNGTSMPNLHQVNKTVNERHEFHVSMETNHGPHALAPAESNAATMTDNVIHDMSCDQETIEAIEQLDKSIDEVILYDDELATTFRYENNEELQKTLDVQEISTNVNAPFSTANVSCQTNINDVDKNPVENKNVPPTESEHLSVDEMQQFVKHVIDASVNTDFDSAEDHEVTERDVYSEMMTHTPVNCTGIVEQSQLVNAGGIENSLATQGSENGGISDHSGSTEMLPIPKLPCENKTAVKKDSPGQRTPGYHMPKVLKPVNGHSNESTAFENENGSTENGTPWMGNSKSCRRMSTATLDGAVVAQSISDLTDSASLHGHHGHFVVVAIDFGTTYSGYAFSFIKDPDNIHIMRKWEGGDPGVINQKTLTTLLLTPEKQFHSVGFTARDHYHDLDPEETKMWLYFDKFKMALHHNANLTKETEIQAANGKAMPAVTVFSHVLRFFKDHTLQELSDQSATRIVNEDIRWVITVPAIWRQPAKQFMREVAYEAGIASPEYPDQLLIALEPEAASIYCRNLRIHQLVSEVSQQHLSSQSKTSITKINNGKYAAEELAAGTRYMVVDCGGGTVDITVHELMDRKGNLKELHKPTGGPCGSVMVDLEFENLLSDIFGADFMEQFKLQRPASFVDLMMAFEARKRNASPFRNNPSNISLPFSFVDFYKKYKGGTIETAIKRYGRKDIRWSSQGMLRLEPTAMHQLFTKAIENIKRHVSHVLAATNNTIKYLFLVGGFAESQLLQQAIRITFDRRVKVIIPQEVSLAILKGAVLYGREPTVVNIRRSKMTYGVGVLNRYVPEIHPPGKRIIKDGIEWCTDVFDRFVTADQSVGLGDVVLRSYTPARCGQTNIILHVYCSERDDISFITDEGVSRCGTLHLDLSDVQYISVPKRREIQTRMIFGDTELKISALDVTTGKCVRAQFNFFNH